MPICKPWHQTVRGLFQGDAPAHLWARAPLLHLNWANQGSLLAFARRSLGLDAGAELLHGRAGLPRVGVGTRVGDTHPVTT